MFQWQCHSSNLPHCWVLWKVRFSICSRCCPKRHNAKMKPSKGSQSPYLGIEIEHRRNVTCKPSLNYFFNYSNFFGRSLTMTQSVTNYSLVTLKIKCFYSMAEIFLATYISCLGTCWATKRTAGRIMADSGFYTVLSTLFGKQVSFSADFAMITKHILLLHICV